jgi:hypothetical protein
MSKKQSTQVVIISDLHVGSTLGLCPPVVYLDDGGKYLPNELQKLSYAYWKKTFWPYVWKKAEKENRRTIVVCNAETIDGSHHGTNQIWSNQPSDQIDVAATVLDEAIHKADVRLFTRGTPAHVGESGAADEAVAKRCKATRPDGRKIGPLSTYHLSLNAGGVLLDISHQGPNAGSRMWTKGNGARSYARTIILDALVLHQKPPDVIVRSHYHKKLHETLREYGHKTEMIVSPAWQWMTSYAFQVASFENVADIGGILISIDNGAVSDIEFKCLSVSQNDTVTVA